MERKEICNGGVRISYIKSGTGHPIILLHGNGEDHSIYSEITEELSNDGFCVFAIDTRGHGMSGAADRLRYEDMAEDVMCVIRNEKMERPTLFGFSDGGITGLLLSMRYPDALGRLIVAGVNLSPEGLTKRTRTAVRFGFFFTRSDKLRLMLTQPNIAKEQLSSVDVPVTVFHAENDMVKLSDSQAVAENVKNGKLVFVKDETHDSYVMDNRKLLRLLREHVLK